MFRECVIASAVDFCLFYRSEDLTKELFLMAVRSGCRSFADVDDNYVERLSQVTPGFYSSVAQYWTDLL